MPRMLSEYEVRRALEKGRLFELLAEVLKADPKDAVDYTPAQQSQDALEFLDGKEGADRWNKSRRKL